LNIEATARFADLVDGILKLGALVLLAYALFRLVPTLRERGFTAKIFGNEVHVDGPSDAVEKLSLNTERQIDDLRAQLTELRSRNATARDAATKGTHQPAASTPAPPRTRTALWVDDEPDNNLFEVGKLREANFVVTQVESTEDAVERLQRDRFDLILTDMGRHENGRWVEDAGLKLIRWIRSKETEQDWDATPVFVYTSSRDVSQYRELVVAERNTQITASPTVLLNSIRELIGG
jgi:CheY-like chemotaxis protein